MGLKCGIVGLPNVGKSTLFNCVSSAKAQAANFPFCTIEPNTGIITVPDPRLTDEAIAWLHTQRALAATKPYFLYFAPGAAHTPHHVPKAWIEKYRGRFHAGWDAERNAIFSRQKRLGVIPSDTPNLLWPEVAQNFCDGKVAFYLEWYGW